jgi:hypothetical protein
MQPSPARHLLPGASRSGPVSPLMILCGSHCPRSRPEINPAAKMVGTSKPKTASAMSGSAADVRNRVLPPLPGPFTRIVPGVR